MNNVNQNESLYKAHNVAKMLRLGMMIFQYSYLAGTKYITNTFKIHNLYSTFVSFPSKKFCMHFSYIGAHASYILQVIF